MPAAGRGGRGGQGGGGGRRLNGGGGGTMSEEERGELRELCEVRERLLDLLEDCKEDRSRDLDRLSCLDLCEHSDGCFFLVCLSFPLFSGVYSINLFS